MTDKCSNCKSCRQHVVIERQRADIDRQREVLRQLRKELLKAKDDKGYEARFASQWKLDLITAQERIKFLEGVCDSAKKFINEKLTSSEKDEARMLVKLLDG